MGYVEELQHVIRHLHKAKAAHVASVPVKEMHEGTTLWEGIVEVFDLHDHPAAKRVYAWANEAENPKRSKRHKAVLHIGPVISPQAAVRTAMLQEFSSLGTTEENRESQKAKTANRSA